MQDTPSTKHRFTSRQAQDLTAYWRKLAVKAGNIPARADFDPIAIPTILPSVFLIERLDNDTYRFRLQGTDFTDRGVSDMTGIMLTQQTAGSRQSPIIDVLTRVLDTPTGLHILGVEQSKQGRQSLVEYVTLPLLDEEGTPRFVVGCGSPLATLGYDDENKKQGPLIEVRDLREISLAEPEGRVA